ncbi:YwqG family protein [Nocardioides sp. CPCC 205120]|uniref:YwqG family protein n=1 Tax=Nocardioides sp. CPCC 205120 TaxID=3406462 RepID=UPI003B50BD33
MSDPWSHPPADGAELAERLAAVGLAGRTDVLAALARPSARLHTLDGASDRDGGSRLGGEPDLRADDEWPRDHRGRPLSFLLQVDLAEVHAALGPNDLPDAGLLSFFYDAAGQPWGFDDDDPRQWRVLHLPAGVPLARRALPDDHHPENRFTPCPVLVAAEPVFADVGDFEVTDVLGTDDAALEAYETAVPPRQDFAHRLLGRPETIQNDLRFDAAIAAAVAAGDPAGEPSEQTAGRWRLLAQVDSDEERTQMLWGDSGRLYFVMTEEDLRARAWERVRVVLQCC